MLTASRRRQFVLVRLRFSLMVIDDVSHESYTCPQKGYTQGGASRATLALVGASEGII